METGAVLDQGDPSRGPFFDGRMAARVVGPGALLRESPRLADPLCFRLPNRQDPAFKPDQPTGLSV